ncbi:ribose-phosphate pyrophosphokinase [Natranaerovirga hydrolytica]|uniref:Ribose-phosphate pyrophosphokinase n=1 Tax=Natranaerovirga hydrolytica TaxID=680378 RepID=A0A4R1MCW7_9FIRM|nr:ribose-phosphate pyrophosphokinase [Natranaerovirga hydrolytica]TCK87869.1 ribose-phosphate pyrophosphokinase [Natranaerovirga hydrolytica]
MTSASMSNEKIKIFAGNANTKLAQEIAQQLGLEVSSSEAGKFSDGEISVKINEMVRGVDVFVVQSTSGPVNDNLMELLIMIDAMRRASAGRITAVIPYYGYARQDRKARARDPISARLVADLLQTAGADRVLSMDLHCAQIQGFFTIPVDHLLGNPLFVDYYNEKFKDEIDNLTVVSPDVGSVQRTRMFAEKLEIPIAIIDKRRPKANVSEIMNIIGDIKGRNVLLVDDMIDTAGTISNAANTLKEKGAKAVYACCTHPVLSGPAIERIDQSAIEELLVLNTIPLSKEKQIDKIKVLSVADIFSNAINRIHYNKSVSQLFL